MPRLTALKVKSIRKPGLHGDGATLFRRVARGGSKQWMQRLTVHGRRHDIGLGSVQLVSLPSPTGRPISDATVSKLCRENGIACTPHGYRTNFRTWAPERTDAPRAVAEAALAHVVGGVEGAYQRSDLFDWRRQLMDAWAEYLSGERASVAPIHG